MLLSGGTVHCRSTDIIDEESTFQKLTEKDEEAQQLLAQQDRVLMKSMGTFVGQYRYRQDTRSVELLSYRLGLTGGCRGQTVSVNP